MMTDQRYEPIDSGVTPRFAGHSTFMRLPVVSDPRQLDIAIVGVPWDTVDTYFGGWKYPHGTRSRRAIEEGFLEPNRVVQIGIRGSTYSADERDWPLQHGIRMISIEEFEDMGIEAAIREARRVVGEEPAYVSFDIDALDPAYAPGTG